MEKLPTNTVKPDLSFFENENLNRILNFDRELSLDSKLEAVDSYMKTNTGIGLSDLEKDEIYATAQRTLNDFKAELRNVKFNFYLNRPQYNLVTDLFLKKLEYDVNNIFIAIELTELLGGMKGVKYKDDVELKCFEANATEITYIYHLIQTHKVKGLTREAYVFSKILIRIGDLSKIISYYDTSAKNLVDDISKWALKMDDSPVMGEAVTPEELENAIEKPEKIGKGKTKTKIDA